MSIIVNYNKLSDIDNIPLKFFNISNKNFQEKRNIFKNKLKNNYSITILDFYFNQFFKDNVLTYILLEIFNKYNEGIINFHDLTNKKTVEYNISKNYIDNKLPKFSPELVSDLIPCKIFKNSNYIITFKSQSFNFTILYFTKYESTFRINTMINEISTINNTIFYESSILNKTRLAFLDLLYSKISLSKQTKYIDQIIDDNILFEPIVRKPIKNDKITNTPYITNTDIIPPTPPPPPTPNLYQPLSIYKKPYHTKSIDYLTPEIKNQHIIKKTNYASSITKSFNSTHIEEIKRINNYHYTKLIEIEQEIENYFNNEPYVSSYNVKFLLTQKINDMEKYIEQLKNLI